VTRTQSLGPLLLNGHCHTAGGRQVVLLYTPVGHANQQDVVERVHAINLGQQLVDNRVVGACAVPHAATLPADGINLVKDDDVQLLQAQLGSHTGHLLFGCQAHSQAQPHSKCNIGELALQARPAAATCAKGSSANIQASPDLPLPRTSVN